MASARVSSPIPGAASRVPVRFTLTLVPSGKTVSRCESTASIEVPAPVPFHTPITLPSGSRSTSVSPARRSIFRYAAPRASSLNGGAGISVSVTSSRTKRS